MTPDYTWQDDAACRGHDTNLWFPGQGEEVSIVAVVLCRSCPVREDCAEHAISYPERWGYWGGTNETQRKSARRGVVGPTIPCSWCGVELTRARRRGAVRAWCASPECQREAKRRKSSRGRGVA